MVKQNIILAFLERRSVGHSHQSNFHWLGTDGTVLAYKDWIIAEWVTDTKIEATTYATTLLNFDFRNRAGIEEAVQILGCQSSRRPFISINTTHLTVGWVC